GISVNDVKHDFNKVIKRSRDIAQGMSKGVNFLMKKNKIDVIMGYGKVLTGKKVEVKSDESTKILAAKNIIIATGGRSRELPSLRQDGKKIIGYREAMNLPKQPKKIVIVGSGAIGVEFAYFYNAMGSKVTIMEYLPNILPNEDIDVSKALESTFKKKGIEIHTSTEVTNVDTSGKSCIVSYKNSKGDQKMDFDIVLSAVGVSTNLDNLGLEAMGIKTESGRVVVDDLYKTTAPGYFAIGDIVHGPALAHVASAEGIICVEGIAGHEPEPLDYSNIPGCTYCSPEVASVGMSEKQAIDAGHEIKVGKFPFSASGKASAAGAKEGFVKMIYDAKYGELLGAHMIGSNVTEMIAEIVAVRKLETTGMELLKTVHPHPTMSEAVMEATAAAYGEVIHL
ncbi:MAG: dihydrolipoyl dehydrogenase, partial [Schleiferiaceae bacterium]|nr:dihydrolipoyl dehydrogenase [Schleiferiaceae bacterium]